MIIGNGDIGKALKEVDRDDLLFFASGVSNSQEERQKEYQREVDLLLEQDKSKRIVYFSTLALFYADTRYTQHKKYIEATIKENFPKYTIVRLGNITWGKNPHTILNYFRSKIKKGEQIPLLMTYRYIIDKSEFLHWVRMIPQWNCEMNITGRRLRVDEIYSLIKGGLL